MPRFDDYHRTVVGYHGTALSSALRFVTRSAEFRPSRRDFDWLGHGIYFWEYAPRQALRFAAIRQRQLLRKRNKTPEEIRRASEPLAVVGCMIRLGNCYDLLEPDHLLDLSKRFADYQTIMALTNQPLPRNTRRYRRLDCAAFEFAYRSIERSEEGRKVESARGVYVPAGGSRRLWEGSWLAHDTHIQICVREPANLLGTWLHQPDRLEVRDVCQTLQDAHDRDGSDAPPEPQDDADDAPGGEG